jgi:hypothetical protein
MTRDKLKRAVKDLINAEGVDVVLIDEKLSSIQRIITEADKVKQEQYPLSEGLTGSCALQKKILNFERPTEDSRFSAKIDQPGSARLKRIVYFGCERQWRNNRCDTICQKKKIY